MLIVVALYAGDLADADAVHALFRALAAPLLDMSDTFPYAVAQSASSTPSSPTGTAVLLEIPFPRRPPRRPISPVRATTAPTPTRFVVPRSAGPSHGCRRMTPCTPIAPHASTSASTAHGRTRPTMPSAWVGPGSLGCAPALRQRRRLRELRRLRRRRRHHTHRHARIEPLARVEARPRRLRPRRTLLRCSGSPAVTATVANAAPGRRRDTTALGPCGSGRTPALSSTRPRPCASVLRGPPPRARRLPRTPAVFWP